MDAQTDNINTMLNSLSNYNECTKLFNAKLDQINLLSDDMEIFIEGSHEAESGYDELPIIDTGDIDSAETCDLKCCEVKDSCCFMSMSEQMERFIKNENNLPILDLKCKDCSKKICSSCLMENSQLTLIQKKLFLRTWQSIKVVKLNGELRGQQGSRVRNGTGKFDSL